MCQWVLQINEQVAPQQMLPHISPEDLFIKNDMEA